ncbi:HAMP domain-containing protein [Brevibacillus humidisoli]|uniref:adenylate/guanylate cyclase domain-containing protein n=1 Tax=Brevibacillus humidisoli TaxID=2895522 RepID=UPI001E609E54|nr:adenylate/guanylate cyclase domain-containing protein [Brevibacillus humidisoli]UFJ38942.1 HAMP domain-containing protein [Brevibacillus humidisoli]
MKKTLVQLLLIAVLISSVGAFAYRYKQEYAYSPVLRDIPLEALSKVVVDGSGNLYTINQSNEDRYHDSDESIVKLDPAGRIQYQLPQQTGENGTYYNFEDVAADPAGNLYILRAVVDFEDLHVRAEEIVRHHSDGRTDQVVYRREYERGQYYVRGNIQALQYRDGSLSFLSVDDQYVEMLQIDLANPSQPELLRLQLPENSYAYQVAGSEPDKIIYSTRQGEIYWLQRDGTTRRVYPLAGETVRAVPESLRLDDNGDIYFLTHTDQLLRRTNLHHPDRLETLLSRDSLTKWRLETSALAADLALGDDNSVIVAFSDRVFKLDKQGKIQHVMDKAVYDGKTLAFRLLLWSLLLVIAGLTVYGGRLLYVRVMGRKVSIILKQIIVLVPVIAAGMLYLSYTISSTFGEQLEEEVLRDIELFGYDGALLIEPELLKQMKSPQQYMGPVYQELKEAMDSVFEETVDMMDSGFYNRLYKFENERLYLIMDDEGTNMFTPFPLDPDRRAALQANELFTSEEASHKAKQVYALVPLFDEQENLTGVYEVGRHTNGFLRDSEAVSFTITMKIITIFVLILLGLIVMTIYVLLSIRKLRNGVQGFADGNLDAVVTIRSRDEVEELGHQFNQMAERIREQMSQMMALHEASYRFVPQQFIEHLGKNSIIDLQMGDHVKQEMTILTANIRSFHLLVQEMTTEQNFRFINAFLRTFSPIITKHGGIVSEYLGSGILALFPQQGGQAVEAAVAMREQLHLFNEKRGREGKKAIEIGIAIHSGPLMLGIIGEEERVEGKVISDEVNRTASLEGLTETLGASILISEAGLFAAGGLQPYSCRNLGMVQVEQGREPILLYDVYQGDADRMRQRKAYTKDWFEEAILLYQQGRFFDAREGFLRVIRHNPLDKAAKHYFFLSDQYYQSGTGKDWNGSLTLAVPPMTEKSVVI